jgi:glycosyltransferase involved in cell wall biosynthesis
MIVYADIRCLQDPGFARRGIGSHAAFLLAAARGLRHGRATVIGLADPSLAPPPPEVAALCDEVQESFAPRSAAPGVFLWLSPMTHDSRPVARFFDRPAILPCAVVYDFIPLLDPERYLGTRAAASAYAARREWLAAARVHLPISAAVGEELVSRVGADPGDVTVTGVALRDAFAARLGAAAPLPPPAAAPPRYVMFVGGPDGRKNLETVVTATASAGIDAALVVAGEYPPRWRKRAAREAAGRVPLVFLDRVDDGELAGWYAHALATVVASRAEGFSMPVIEAMACGAPVIASDIPCHRELVEDPAARFDPGSAAELARRLRDLAADPSARARLRAAQRPVPDRFTAEKVAERFVAALELRVPGHERRARRAARTRRPLVALVSPFPPDRSGVADYTRRTVAALSAHADVDVWTDCPEPEADAHVRAFHPVSAAAWMRPDYDATVAVFGNSSFHAPILDHHLRYGGPCILHDSRLVDLYAWWHGPERTRVLAEAELGRSVSAAELREWTGAQGRLPTLFLSEVVRAGGPVFVHSRGLADEIRRLYGVQAVWLPFALLRDFPAWQTTTTERRAARARLGVGASTRLVVTLGIYGPAKAPETCADAVAALRAEGRDVELVFVGGDPVAAAGLLRRTRAAGLGGAIRCTGDWLADDVYRDWILAADAAVQLRSHRFGGISAALMDCIAAGVPTVANEDLAAALDAPSTVRRVPDAFTVADVAAGLREALRGEEARDERARSRYRAEHSMDAYVDRLLGALDLGASAPLRAGPRPLRDAG